MFLSACVRVVSVSVRVRVPVCVRARARVCLHVRVCMGQIELIYARTYTIFDYLRTFCVAEGIHVLQ